MTPELSDADKMILAELLRETIARDRFPLSPRVNLGQAARMLNLTDEHRAYLARFLREAIETDRDPLSARVVRLKALLTKIDPCPRQPRRRCPRRDRRAG